MSAVCKSCGAAIVWAVTGSGRVMPVDAEPAGEIPRGAFTLGYARDGELRASAVPNGGRACYVSHFATCPNAASHRKGKTDA